MKKLSILFATIVSLSSCGLFDVTEYADVHYYDCETTHNIVVQMDSATIVADSLFEAGYNVVVRDQTTYPDVVVSHERQLECK